MTSTIKVNNIQNQCGANIINESANTITIGASGDTIALASGASQTGFGRTGTVNWNTTPITSTPTTGANGIGYFIDASGGVRTINLPASPSAGDIMAISDYAQIAATNNITIGRNGSNIQGNASDLVLARNGVAITLVYVDATKGWVVTDTGAEADKEPDPAFITATGGTITCCGDFKIHTFTGPGTFTVSCAGNPLGSDTVSYMVVAGGGGGGADWAACTGGGGAGAGGFREFKTTGDTYTASPLNGNPGGTAVTITATSFPITVGAGGAGKIGACGQPVTPSNGNPSVFSTITSTGGGGGASNNGGTPNPSQVGGNGGSGGGSTFYNTGGTGTGNTPPVSPAQGTNGGAGSPNSGNSYLSGGGGGATSVGSGGNPGDGGGGNGATTSITGSPTTYAGGGGGGYYGPVGPRTSGPGGPGGGGAGGQPPCGPAGTPATGKSDGSNGTANTGGGGGGGTGANPSNGGGGADGGSGGSGIVIIRYKFQ